MVGSQDQDALGIEADPKLHAHLTDSDLSLEEKVVFANQEML